MGFIMYIIGFIIFSLYILFTAFNIKKDVKEDKTRDYYRRHKQPDIVDYDGMGNQGRIPRSLNKEKKKYKLYRKKPYEKIS